MNLNEMCLMNYLIKGKKGADKSSRLLINLLIKNNAKFTFPNINPVQNIIDEMEIFGDIKK